MRFDDESIETDRTNGFVVRSLATPTDVSYGREMRGIRKLRSSGVVVVAFAAAMVVGGVPVPVAHAQVDGVTVDFSADNGVPEQRASGILYGISEDGSQPGDDFFTEIGFGYERAGGAQLDSPGGWAAGKYQRRWDATLAQYNRTVSLGGEFVLLPHDLWGADGTTQPPYPGDGGDWSEYDAFLDQVISDVRNSGMDPQWDIWNEPDIPLFWDRSQEQYLELWERTYTRIRAAFPEAVIVGPSTAFQPAPDNEWWRTYLEFVTANNLEPDIVSWHSLSRDVDPAVNKEYADQLLTEYGVGQKPYQINEYGAPEEQNPGNSAWYISRLERLNIDGLRANWASGQDLHDFMAALLTRNDVGEYVPLGDWIAYREYAAMTGVRTAVAPGSDIDGFATRDADAGNAKVLLGNHGVTGEVSVELTGLDSTPYVVRDGQVRVVVERVPWNDGAAVEGTEPVSDDVVQVDGNVASITVPWSEYRDAYTVTLLPPGE